MNIIENELEISDVTKKILKDYNLDFRIEKLPSVVIKNNEIINSSYFSLLNVSTMEILNQVKSTYHVSQNDTVVELAVRGLSNFRNMKITKGGVINGGRKIYLQISIEGNALVGDDIVKRYVTILDSNDGSTSLSIGIGDETMSCENQFFKFYKEGESKYRHSSNLETRILEIESLIENALLASMRMTGIYQEFQKTPITKDLVSGLINELLNTEKVDKEGNLIELKGKALSNMEELERNLKLEMLGDFGGYIGKGENLWGLFSGVTRWTTHTKQAPKRDNGRLESIMCGTNYKFNQKAFDYCLKSLNIERATQGLELVKI